MTQAALATTKREPGYFQSDRKQVVQARSPESSAPKATTLDRKDVQMAPTLIGSRISHLRRIPIIHLYTLKDNAHE